MKRNARVKNNADTGAAMVEHKIYVGGDRYIRQIRKVVGEELWDKVRAEVESTQWYHTSDGTVCKRRR